MTARALSLALALVLAPAAGGLVFACGGKPADAPKGAETADASPPTASAEPDAASPSGPTTTTTATLADGGDLQGTKLTPSGPTAAGGDAGAAHGDGGAKHDPGRGPEDVFGMISNRRDEARACYDAELKKNPKVSEGTLWIDFVIDPEGNVTEPKLNESASDIKEAPVVSCVIAFLKKLKFPKSPRGMQSTTNYKFGFKRNARPSPRP